MAELNHGRRRSTWVGVAVGIALIVVLVISCLGIALPALIGPRLGHARPKWSEAKGNLRSAFLAEKACFAEKGMYDESIEVAGFLPERANRYRYVFSKSGDSISPGDEPDGGPHTGVLVDSARYPSANDALLLRGIPPAVLSTVGIEGTCPACDITIIAAGDIDSDPTVDVWSISTKARTIDGGLVPAGVPFRHVDDSEL